MKKIATYAGLAGVTAVFGMNPCFAHEGHGMASASHWHATDALGFIAFGAAVVLAVWFSGRGK